MQMLLKIVAVSALMTLVGCAHRNQAPIDNTAMRLSDPKSILVVAPQNNSPEVNGTYGVLAQTMYPLAEAGYYVFPVAVVNETFQQNGLTEAGDIHTVPVEKLREIFGADAVLYITVEEYGVSYKVLSSESIVAVEGTIIDTRTGEKLWTGSARASNKEGGSGGGNLVGQLVVAVVEQVINTTIADPSFGTAGVAVSRMINGRGGVPAGHRARAAHETR